MRGLRHHLVHVASNGLEWHKQLWLLSEQRQGDGQAEIVNQRKWQHRVAVERDARVAAEARAVAAEDHAASVLQALELENRSRRNLGPTYGNPGGGNQNAVNGMFPGANGMQEVQNTVPGPHAIPYGMQHMQTTYAQHGAEARIQMLETELQRLAASVNSGNDAARIKSERELELEKKVRLGVGYRYDDRLQRVIQVVELQKEAASRCLWLCRRYCLWGPSCRTNVRYSMNHLGANEAKLRMLARERDLMESTIEVVRDGRLKWPF